MSAEIEALRTKHFLRLVQNKDAEPRTEQLVALFNSAPPATQQELMGALIAKVHDFDRLVEIQEKLRAEIEALSAPPGYLATLVNMRNGTGPLRAEVVAGGGRFEVSLHPDLDPHSLDVGHTLVLNHERNCALASRGYTTAGGELCEVEMVHEDGSGRLTISHRDDRLVIETAAVLRQQQVGPGDTVRFERSAGMAFELVTPPKGHVPKGVLVEDIPQTTFAQIGGMKEQLKKIQQVIVLPLMHPEQCRRYGIQAPRGMILWGPPGNGKTMVAQALANHLAQLSGGKGRFIVIKGPELLSMWVGESERKIREVLRTAREMAEQTGLIVFIFWDEIDAIARTRGSSRFSNVEGTIIPTLLGEIQGFESSKKDNKVLICAATNRLDLLDPALIRPGRLGDVILHIGPPNRSGAQEIMAKYLTADKLDKHTCPAELIEPALSQIYAPVEESQLATLVFRDGGRLPVYRKEMISGAMIEQLVATAARRACWREIDLVTTGGIEAGDLSVAIEEQFSNLAKNLKPHNVRDHLSTLPQDREVVAVEPKQPHAQHQHLRRT